MEIKRTKNIYEAIYGFEKANNIYEKQYWGGDDDNNTINAIYGDDAENMAKEEKIKIGTTKLNENTMYIFHWNLKKTILVPFHVSMKPKTTANIINGSKNYGELSIIEECF